MATYYVRADGTATNKAAATNPALASGSYMQVVSGGNQAYQTWTPGSLRRVRFMDKVGAGERVGIKSLKINKKARWV